MSKAKARAIYKDALRKTKSANYDAEEVLKLLMQAADEGSGDAAAAIASWFAHGKHVKKHSRKAVQWFQRAADMGNAEGLYGLAGAYERGIGGLEKDQKKAFELYIQSALLGEKFSLPEVARCYKYGIGVAADENLARIWLDRAIQLGVPI